MPLVSLEKYKTAELQFLNPNLALKEFELKDTHDKKPVTFQNNCGNFFSIITKGKA